MIVCRPSPADSISIAGTPSSVTIRVIIGGRVRDSRLPIGPARRPNGLARGGVPLNKHVLDQLAEPKSDHVRGQFQQSARLGRRSGRPPHVRRPRPLGHDAVRTEPAELPGGPISMLRNRSEFGSRIPRPKGSKRGKPSFLRADAGTDLVPLRRAFTVDPDFESPIRSTGSFTVA